MRRTIAVRRHRHCSRNKYHITFAAGPSRHFAATRQFGRFRRTADSPKAPP